MQQIESQASDLRYLAQGPAPMSESAGAGNDMPQHGAQPSPSHSLALGYGEDSAPVSTRRRSPPDDGTAAQRPTRSKRNRYTSIACNQCKRRKIKCNGETPCHRCGHMNLPCEYAPSCCTFKDSDEFKTLTTQVSQHQEEIASLKQTLDTLQTVFARQVTASSDVHANGATPGPAAPSPSQSLVSMSRPVPPPLSTGAFRGPTGMAYSLDEANNTIPSMGIRNVVELDEQYQRGSPGYPSYLTSIPGHQDPLLDFHIDEMVRLCRLHEEEIGIMYPVLDMRLVIDHARNLVPLLDEIRIHRAAPENLNDEATLQLKMIMCCALVVESHGDSAVAVRIFESMEALINKKLMSDQSSVSSLPLLCLLAGYRFLSNEELLAWRVIGHVLRLCIEIGIHRQKTWGSIQDESVRRNTLVSFWTAYVLDRRWAFGTGLPFAIQDDLIDPDLPFPHDHPFLVAMITYSRVGAKVWRELSHSDPTLGRELRQQELERLNVEIQQWYDTVPDDVKIRNWQQQENLTFEPSYDIQRLRIWTYLRLNQIRIWLYTPILHSPTSILEHGAEAYRVVNLAKDTIQFLHHLNCTTNLYRRAQVFYHQFLSSAIAVMFLAAVHGPVTFSDECRAEFRLALDLVKGLSSKSWVSQRLWRTIKALRGHYADDTIDPALSPSDDTSAQSPPLTRATAVPARQGWEPRSNFLESNGQRIVDEFIRVFEDYVSMPSYPFPSEEQTAPQSEPGSGPPTRTITPGGGVYPHLRDMF